VPGNETPNPRSTQAESLREAIYDYDVGVARGKFEDTARFQIVEYELPISLIDDQKEFLFTT
jgi:hypothetical protein